MRVYYGGPQLLLCWQNISAKSFLIFSRVALSLSRLGSSQVSFILGFLGCITYLKVKSYLNRSVVRETQGPISSCVGYIYSILILYDSVYGLLQMYDSLLSQISLWFDWAIICLTAVATCFSCLFLSTFSFSLRKNQVEVPRNIYVTYFKISYYIKDLLIKIIFFTLRAKILFKTHWTKILFIKNYFP